jgi:hypothetical protein
LGDPSARLPWIKPCWESYGFAQVGTELQTPVVDCLDGADGAVDERRVTVAVAGVEQHPVADLVVAIGCPSGTRDRAPAEGAGVGEPAADAIGEVLGLRVRHDQCDRGLRTEGKMSPVTASAINLRVSSGVAAVCSQPWSRRNCCDSWAPPQRRMWSA